ncbi:MAG: hypothetical protein ACR2GX_00765 [Candidatus Dormibacteria bacterium]
MALESIDEWGAFVETSGAAIGPRLAAAATVFTRMFTRQSVVTSDTDGRNRLYESGSPSLRDVFDANMFMCSESAFLVQEWLQREGFNARTVIGGAIMEPHRRDSSGALTENFHTYLLVRDGGTDIVFDAVNPQMIPGGTLVPSLFRSARPVEAELLTAAETKYVMCKNVITGQERAYGVFDGMVSVVADPTIVY